MANNEQPRVVTSTQFYHALLRPTVLQILRAQGYYSCTPAVLDVVTDLVARHLMALCEQTARNSENLPWPTQPTIVEVRKALEESGVFGPIRTHTAEQWATKEDTSGVDSFISWAKGEKNRKIRKVAGALQEQNDLDEAADEPVTDYLSALKKKHNKNDQDSKYAGTILGKGIDHGEILIEGGDVTSIREWSQKMRDATQRPRDGSPDSRPPSSGLSSLADDEVEMMEL